MDEERQWIVMGNNFGGEEDEDSDDDQANGRPPLVALQSTVALSYEGHLPMPIYTNTYLPILI